MSAYYFNRLALQDAVYRTALQQSTATANSGLTFLHAQTDLKIYGLPCVCLWIARQILTKFFVHRKNISYLLPRLNSDWIVVLK